MSAKKASKAETEIAVVLELTMAEARTLQALVGNTIGGTNTARKFSDAIFYALQDIGVESSIYKAGGFSPSNSVIEFNEASLDAALTGKPAEYVGRQ